MRKWTICALAVLALLGSVMTASAQELTDALPPEAQELLDGLEEERTHCKEVIYDLNHLHPRDWAQIPEILKALFGRTGEDVWLEPPFHCDYGWDIEGGGHPL